MSQTDLFIGLCDSLGIVANPAIDLQYRQGMMQQQKTQRDAEEKYSLYPRMIIKMVKICRYFLLLRKKKLVSNLSL